MPKSRADEPAGRVEAGMLSGREKYVEFFTAGLLFAFGIYLSVLYFGHKVVPISDFPDIARGGHELLSLKVPSSFKIAPLVGVLQAGLSYLVGGQCPDLTAGWLLNALLHPFNLILLWLIGRRIVGKAAAWFAVIAILNPWVLYLLREPLIETTLLFFTLLTFYFIFKRSKWCYLFASITAMARYEGTALILAAFVMDMIYSESRRERVRAFLYSAAAAVPLIIWLFGTVVNWKTGTTHYFSALFTKEYSKGFESGQSRTGLAMHMKLLWQVGFYPLLMPYPAASHDFGQMLWKLSKATAIISFFFGCIYGLFKREWKILMLLIFFVPYFVLHAAYPYPIPRYHATIFWIALLLSLFGLQSFWKLINADGRLPRSIVLVLQALTAIAAIVWLVILVPYLSKLYAVSPRSVSVPYAAMTLGGLFFIVGVFIYKSGHVLREFSVLAVVCLIIVSNQFYLVSLLGDGQADKEFKLLAEWYVKNAKPGEKLAVYMNGITRVFVPKCAEYIVGFPKADGPAELVNACYEENITYVVWATREGLSKDHYGYRLLGLERNIAFLDKSRNVGPYEFITQVGSRRGYVNIFRLRRPTEGTNLTLPR